MNGTNIKKHFQKAIKLDLDMIDVKTELTISQHKRYDSIMLYSEHGKYYRVIITWHSEYSYHM